MDFIDKVRIEVVAAPAQVPERLETIQQAAKTGHIGDGKIFVSPVEEVLRIRTGETGLEAV